MSDAPSIPHAHQFQDAATQAHAARFGMWIFLATEVMLFAALFCGYSVYRSQYPEAFATCSHHLDTTMGTLETVDLITSSFFVALALHFVRQNRSRVSGLCLLIAAAMALGFLGMHSTEYFNEWREGALPGRYYHFMEVQIPGSAMFFTLYFFLTGVHAFHVTIGMSVLLWLSWKTLRGSFDARSHTALELGGLYWHLVDLIWIFLFPLLYLIG